MTLAQVSLIFQEGYAIMNLIEVKNTYQEAVMKKYMAIIAAFIIAFQASFLATTVFAANNYLGRNR